MSTALYIPVVWAAGSALSSFVLFKADGPNGLLIPAGMVGAQMTFFRAPFENGAVVPGSAVALFDILGARVSFMIAATARVIVFHHSAIRGIGYLGLRTEDAAGTAVVQVGAATAFWLGATEAPLI